MARTLKTCNDIETIPEGEVRQSGPTGGQSLPAFRKPANRYRCLPDETQFIYLNVLELMSSFIGPGFSLPCMKFN